MSTPRHRILGRNSKASRPDRERAEIREARRQRELTRMLRRVPAWKLGGTLK